MFDPLLIFVFESVSCCISLYLLLSIGFVVLPSLQSLQKKDLGVTFIAIMFKSLLIGLSLAALPLCNASPIPCDTPSLTPSAIVAIAPDSASCFNATYPAECANATDAAPWINEAFSTFSIDAFGTQAALLSLMLFETDSFKYKINHFPGVPGQGTRNMQSPAFNLKYAEWLAANATDSGISTSQVEAADAEGPEQVLALVNDNRWGFASAAWFLATQCDEKFRGGLAAQTEDGWNSYLTDCIGTTVTDDRTAIWKKAIALGKW